MSRPVVQQQSNPVTGPFMGAVFPPPLPPNLRKFIGKDAKSIRVTYDEYGQRTEIQSLLSAIKGQPMLQADQAVWISIDEHKRRRALLNEETEEERAESFFRRVEERLGLTISPGHKIKTDEGVKKFSQTLSVNDLKIINMSQKAFRQKSASEAAAKAAAAENNSATSSAANSAGTPVARPGVTSGFPIMGITTGRGSNPSPPLPPKPEEKAPPSGKASSPTR